VTIGLTALKLQISLNLTLSFITPFALMVKMLPWLGGYFNPKTFDPNIVNRCFLWNDSDMAEELVQFFTNLPKQI